MSRYLQLASLAVLISLLTTFYEYHQYVICRKLKLILKTRLNHCAGMLVTESFYLCSKKMFNNNTSNKNKCVTNNPDQND